ncbi:MAG TPA: glycosyltransferase family 39 protein [Dongiaceae bacterium]
MADVLDREMRPEHWTMLAAILAVATFFRVVALDAQGLWTDEALTIVLSNWSIPDMLLRPIDPTPALYYILHKLLIPASASLEIVRSISVVAGVASVGLMFLLGRLAFGVAGGLLAAALLAVWSAHVDYSQEARAYSVLFLLTLLTSLGLVRYAQADAGKHRRRFALALFCIGNVLSFYTHVVATFWIVLTSALLLAAVGHEWRIRWRELFVAFGAMAVAAAPGIYRLVEQMRIGDPFHWLQQADVGGFADTSAAVFLPVGLWNNPLTSTLGTGVIAEAMIGAVSLALLIAGCWLGRRRLSRSRQERPIFHWLILAYLIVPMLVWLFGFVARPLFMDRTILFAVPGMILLIVGVCLAQARRVAVLAAAGAVFLYSASTLSFGIVREKEDWRGAYEYLAAHASPDDVVAVCPLYNYPALRYHALLPVASAVLGVAHDGTLLEVEHGLGTNPDWDKTYFRSVLVPETTGKPAAKPDAGVPALVSLRPGQSIWRVDGHCNTGFSGDLYRALSVVGSTPDTVWSQTRKDPRAFGVAVRRYRIGAPAALNVQDIAPQRRLTPPFLNSASMP